MEPPVKRRRLTSPPTTSPITAASVLQRLAQLDRVQEDIIRLRQLDAALSAVINDYDTDDLLAGKTTMRDFLLGNDLPTDNLAILQEALRRRLLTVPVTRAECPVCCDAYRDPTLFEPCGHVVCATHVAQLDKCPKCRAAFTDTRRVYL